MNDNDVFDCLDHAELATFVMQNGDRIVTNVAPYKDDSVVFIMPSLICDGYNGEGRFKYLDSLNVAGICDFVVVKNTDIAMQFKVNEHFQVMYQHFIKREMNDVYIHLGNATVN